MRPDADGLESATEGSSDASDGGDDHRPDPAEYDRACASSETQLSDRLKGAFVLLVGFSSATMALQGGASARAIGLATIIGLVAGAALVWYLQTIFD
ncbi:hypothetical protein [Natronorubrum daqingense]|uniref:Uncharacterized protein n=1 Tax=Natronorubrum daqingense TaxID=588898 RepID=A0A1N7C537_9EURY|nr:hypothetical protein [Natronorubrum daqingense]APX96745.1 hypothetical protein BB347_09010 [Natronorubrum daqingense]SIR58705.1 hypothetical protein SAMN05421809_1523 [Natronorubrum daqingense]